MTDQMPMWDFLNGVARLMATGGLDGPDVAWVSQYGGAGHRPRIEVVASIRLTPVAELRGLRSVGFWDAPPKLGFRSDLGGQLYAVPSIGMLADLFAEALP